MLPLHPPSPSPALHPSPAQTSSGPRWSAPVAWNTAAARPSSSISCPQSAPSVSASAPPGSRWRLPPPAASASASWPPPSACGQSSRCAASSAVTGNSFRPASPIGSAEPCPPSSTAVSASGKPCPPWPRPLLSAASSPDFFPAASSVLHKSAPASAPGPPPAASLVLVHQRSPVAFTCPILPWISGTVVFLRVRGPQRARFWLVGVGALCVLCGKTLLVLADR